MNINVGKAIIHNRKSVTSSAAALGSSTELRYGLQLIAEGTNSAAVYVGNSSVSTGNGFPLDPSGSLFIPIDNLSTAYAVSSTGTQFVRFIGA